MSNNTSTIGSITFNNFYMRANGNEEWQPAKQGQFTAALATGSLANMEYALKQVAPYFSNSQNQSFELSANYSLRQGNYVTFGNLTITVNK